MINDEESYECKGCELLQDGFMGGGFVGAGRAGELGYGLME
jgi:hypothetical protein